MKLSYCVIIFFLSQSCYNDLKDGEIIALAETAVRKADLKRKKNDEQAEASVGAAVVMVLLLLLVVVVVVVLEVKVG